MNNALQIITEITKINQTLSGDEYLKKFIEKIAEHMDVKYAFIGHTIGNDFSSVETDIVYANHSFIENFIYDLKNTPCELVLTGKRVCIHSSNVSEIFEKDELLKQMGVESYIGAPVLDSNQNPIGLLVLLDDKPMIDKEFYTSIIEFLAIRASTEIEKARIEETLKKEVEKRTEELETAKKEIEHINRNLAARVKDEIDKNRKQQRIIDEQSKMAVMSEFIESITHLWTQPLSTIEAHSSGVLLKNELGMLDDEFLTNSMNSITISSEFLSKTINEFNDFFTRNKNKELYSVKECIEKTINLMSARFKDTKIKLVTNTIEHKEKGYSNEFIQVFLNILVNSVDVFEVSNLDKRVIFIDSYYDDKYFIVKIKDSAGGIKESIMDSIFEPYTTTKLAQGGTGIGLYMTKKLVEDNLGGKILVENVEYEYENKKLKGAQFSIVLKRDD